MDAETVFFDRIDTRDARLTQEAYDRAPEGSVERYRAGIVLRGKAAMKEVLTVFTEPNDVATRQAFAKNLDEMAGMVENWDRAVRAEKPEGCPALQGSANSVIANGRKAVQSAEGGPVRPRFRHAVHRSPAGVQRPPAELLDDDLPPQPTFLLLKETSVHTV